jgi:cell division protein FtsN
MRRQSTKSSGAAGLFVLLGILTILGVTFAAGTYAGRIWATKPHAASAPEREAKLRGGDVRVPRISEATPRLTFYQELTAPLTAPPPPPKPAKPLPTPSARALPESERERTAPPPPTSVGRDGATTVSNRPPTAQAGLASPATTDSASGANHRFTIQVGAYRLRPPAEALRSTLAAAGHDARVIETDAPNGVRFRVQIGDFANRDAARDAAARLTGPTFVTTR